MKGTKEYAAWQGIKTRTQNPNSGAAHNYMLRGIGVDAAWTGPHGFSNFFRHMGLAPSAKHSVERLDNDKGYGPGNCAWATRSEQNNNTRQNVFLTYEGHRLTATQWAERLGINLSTILSRLRSGLPLSIVFQQGRLPRRSSAETVEATLNFNHHTKEIT